MPLPKRLPRRGCRESRRVFVTALMQSEVYGKVAQRLARHHSASCTLDQYADAVP